MVNWDYSIFDSFNQFHVGVGITVKKLSSSIQKKHMNSIETILIIINNNIIIVYNKFNSEFIYI